MNIENHGSPDPKFLANHLNHHFLPITLRESVRVSARQGFQLTELKDHGVLGIRDSC